MKLKFKYYCIDFDGTIACDAYPEIGDLIPGAKETMEKIKELGGEIAIWTCRTHDAADNAKAFLEKHNIPYDKFNKPFDENVNIYGGDHSRKIFADCYIDDRSVQFGCKPVDWKIVQDAIFIDEEWHVGDILECIKEIPYNYKVGDKLKINYIDGSYIAIGEMGTNIYDARKYFKKVN
jgi:hypothetical protein